MKAKTKVSGERGIRVGMVAGVHRQAGGRLHEQIKRRLVAAWQYAGAKAGVQLPSVRAIGARFHTSRVTAMRTVAALRHGGLVYSVPRQGVFWGRPRAVVLYRTIGVAFPITVPLDRAHAPSYFSMFETMRSMLARRQYHLKVIPFGALATARDLGVFCCDGLVFTGKTLDRLALVESCRRQRMPYLILDRPRDDESLNYVERDSARNVYELTRYLLERGHTRIGLVGFRTRLWIRVKAVRGFRRALAERGLDDPGRLFLFDREPPAFRPADLARLPVFGRGHTALVIASPAREVIELVVRSLWAAGIRIPRDCSIVCLGGDDDGRIDALTLTRFAVTSRQMGQAAARGILQLVERRAEPPLHIKFPTRIREGNSVREAVNRIKTDEKEVMP